MEASGTVAPGSIHEPIWNERHTPFVKGTIQTVNADRWTVDVLTEEPLELLLRDIPIMSPFYNYKFGNGLFMLPEPDTICVVGRHQDSYFIIGFLPPADAGTTIKVKNEPDQDLFTAFQDRVAVTKEAFAREEAITDPPGRQSYRSNREDDMLAGDGVAKTSAGNKFKWLTNGTLLAESSKLCLRIWSRLRNTIIDIFVNYQQIGPGFQHEVNVDEDDPKKPVNVRTQVAKATGDKEPSIIIEKGATPNVYRLTVQTEDGDKRHEFRIADDGAITLKIGNDLANPDIEISYSNNGEISRKGTAGIEEEAGTEYNIKAGTQVTVEAPNILLKDSSGTPVPLTKFSELAIAFLAHTHLGVTSGGDLSGTPSQPLDASIGTTVVKGV